MANELPDRVSNSIRKHFDHDAAKQALREKYEAKMLFAAFGGMWKAGPKLLTTTMTLLHLDEAVILDEYGNPCKINPAELSQMAGTRWQEQMNGWFVEFEELRNRR